ncbi:CAP domain-containing protein [Amaricoccus sp.]|uniref:CAP domain-containing protein n=1 Tax=Amaricoccus sp. TaxID=1872485 RepID=UPI001B68A01F|nr:CAP domain-containing protein [Amaricoccus sp.]MBP7000142.1 hypothetical protein [Amaricoccus sp.]
MELSRRQATGGLLAIWAAACAGAAGALPARAATISDDALLSADDFCAALLVGINAERAANGLKPLARDPKLTAAARHQAGIMANARIMEHEIPGTPNFPARLRAARARVRTGGENILRDNLSRYGLGCAAVSADLPRRLAPEVATVSVPRWIGSPKHFANIMNARFRRAGGAFAIVVDEPGCGQIYVAQVFGG